MKRFCCPKCEVCRDYSISEGGGFCCVFFSGPGPSRSAFDGQTGTVIFEEKFTGDSGGWIFGADDGLVLKAPGATLTVGAGEEGRSEKQLNETFNATRRFLHGNVVPGGRTDADIGVTFLATDYTNLC